MIPVSAPLRVHAHLRRSSDGPVRVVHRGRDAVYVDVGGRCVGVIGRRATAVPCALRSLAESFDVGSAHLRDGVLHLDGVPVTVGRLLDVGVPPLAGAASTLTGVETVAEQLGIVLPVITPAVVARLIGRGDGLTPLGDDVLCGWIAVHRAAGVGTPAVDAAVRARLSRTTLLSASLLDCALNGEVVPEFAVYVSALGAPAETDAAAALAAIGHTSGSGLLHGARLALSALHTPGVAA
ncbi:DUF2877 domain-containing protein [Pseudonocardia sp. K10HN5]|uniref:DUF2877 domain-containing protein n=1 Tax=Pseudonocardia acidicola TaxID=2724939 RepID=A0ABX1SAC7_9PSEU|nr:DUF2877 domain-containing protein [Pseudonocardia acidicola]